MQMVAVGLVGLRSQHGAEDAARALVTAGVEPGEKIAVEAATLINQIR